jgi:hypothetical protein
MGFKTKGLNNLMAQENSKIFNECLAIGTAAVVKRAGQAADRFSFGKSMALLSLELNIFTIGWK